MTLYDLVNTVTLQGDICITVFVNGHEKERRYLDDMADVNCYCDDLDDLEDLQVIYMYASRWMGKTRMFIDLEGGDE